MAQQKKAEEKFDENYFTSPQGHIRDRIVIHDGPGIPQGGQFFHGLNGFHFSAPTGIEIDIPRPVRKMLDTLVQTQTQRVDEGNGVVKNYVRNIPRVSYTLVKENVGSKPDPKVPKIDPVSDENPFLASASAGG